MALAATTRATAGTRVVATKSDASVSLVDATAMRTRASADGIPILDLETWQVTGTLSAGKEPDGMGYSPL